MNAYLSIAEQVLRIIRRPLSARAILLEAFSRDLVPINLYGKNQHRTLQARLSENIVKYRDDSTFFRSAPGRFFLTELMHDISIPMPFRTPVATRRRTRELKRGRSLAIELNILSQSVTPGMVVGAKDMLKIFHNGGLRYDDPKAPSPNHIFVRAFVCVRRASKVLTYRLGRYRDQRDAFMSRRTIGFTTFVRITDHNLFNGNDFGIVDAGVEAVKLDLDMHHLANNQHPTQIKTKLAGFIWTKESVGGGDLLAVIQFKCPDDFEPLKRRLALNDVCWMDMRSNDLSEFDPWSRQVLLSHYQRGLLSGARHG